MTGFSRWMLLVLLGNTIAFRPNTSLRNLRVPLTVSDGFLNQGKHHWKNQHLLLLASNDKDDATMKHGDFVDFQRRIVWKKAAVQVASAVVGVTALAALTRPAWATSKSRTAGYPVQKTESEWKAMLSPVQYNILRQGGTERSGFSILEKEKRPGTFKCAGCGTPLFVTADKFNSGTGWPSFARGLPGVEVERVDPLTANLSGAELRCKTCGGHLGDVFRDGFLFQGTEAAVTGQRFCIDGAALVFYPDDDDAQPLRGDVPARTR